MKNVMFSEIQFNHVSQFSRKHSSVLMQVIPCVIPCEKWFEKENKEKTQI